MTYNNQQPASITTQQLSSAENISKILQKVYNSDFKLRNSDFRFIERIEKETQKNINKSNSKIELSIKTLFTFLNRQPYGVLNQKSDFNPFLLDENKIDIIIASKAFSALKKCLNMFTSNKSIKVSQGNEILKIIYTLTNDQKIEINFKYNYSSKGLHFALFQKSLLNTETNYFGIKQVSQIDSLEYSLCFYTVNNIGIPKEILKRILPKLNGSKVKLFNYLNTKYSLNIANTDDLLHLKKKNKKNVLKVIQRKAENKKAKKFNTKFFFSKNHFESILGMKFQFKTSKPSL